MERKSHMPIRAGVKKMKGLLQGGGIKIRRIEIKLTKILHWNERMEALKEITIM
jgi:hypothetical protein